LNAAFDEAEKACHIAALARAAALVPSALLLGIGELKWLTGRTASSFAVRSAGVSFGAGFFISA
jgi:hypothetical protein